MTRSLRLPLETPRLRLRLPTLRDAPDYLRILRARPVARVMIYRNPVTPAGVRKFIAQRRIDARGGSRYDLTIELRSDRTAVGRVALKKIDLRNRDAELAYCLNPDHWGEGLATEASVALCRAGFRQLRLQRIDAGVFEFNRRSIAVLERVGFQREGVRRAVVRVQGRWRSEVRYGLLRGELRSPSSSS